MSNGPDFHNPLQPPTPPSAGTDGVSQTPYVGLSGGFRGGDVVGTPPAEQVTVAAFVSAERVLQLLVQEPIFSSGMELGIRRMVADLIKSTPDLKQHYEQIRASQSLGEYFLSAATFGCMPSPAQRFVSALSKVVADQVTQLIQQGLVQFSIVPPEVCSSEGGGITVAVEVPFILFNLSITDSGMRALAESTRLQ